jgi:hypothetical protein
MPKRNEVTDPLVSYPFPLREGNLVWVHLPADLTDDEAERLGAYVRSIAR